MEQKRVAAYCRVSTVAELQDSSFETQREAYIQLIDSREDLVLVDVYGDHGKSGTTIKHRTEFQRMLRDCEAGKIDIIMTKSISRFARNLRDCLTTIDRLKELGIAVIFEKEGINTMDNKSDLLLNVLAVIAEEESASIGQNIRWAHERRNAAGDPFHKPPYGYGRDKKANRWYIRENEAKRVRFAFQSAAKGMCYQEIIKGLNAIEREEGKDFVWGNSRLMAVLTHEAYIGDILTNKTYCPNHTTQVRNRGERDQYYIEGHHEPIVDRATFARVQTLVERKLLWSGRRTFTQEDLDILNNIQPVADNRPNGAQPAVNDRQNESQPVAGQHSGKE